MYFSSQKTWLASTLLKKVATNSIFALNYLQSERYSIAIPFLLLIRVKLVFRGIATSFEGKHGSIRYWLKVEMDKPWSFNHKTKKAFTVISPIDINQPEYVVSFLIHH